MSQEELFSTANYGSSKFKPHGRIDSRVEGTLFVQEGTGPFNKETFLAMRSVHAEAKKRLPSGFAWFGLFIFKKSALAPLEMLDGWREYLKQQKSENRASTATAIVLPKVVEAAELMTPLYLRVWSEAGIPCKAFETVEDGRHWLESWCDDRQVG